MISVIVCSRTDPHQNDHERNVTATIRTDFEYLRIDNREGKYGICAAYNEGVSRARGNILAFVHEDVFFLERGWGAALELKMAADPCIGLIGVAGTQYLFTNNRYWSAAGAPFTRGRIVQIMGDKEMISVFNWDKSDADVVAVDGLFFAVRASLFEKISFDTQRFPGFHFYDLDICMQIRRCARLIVTWDILLKHLSIGVTKESFLNAGTEFLTKWKDELPASCADTVPTSSDAPGVKNYVLKKPLPPTILE
jgi:hypothetical protein